MKIYIASRFKNKPIIPAVVERLKEWGHDVVSRWHTVEDEPWTVEEAVFFDLEDLNNADALLLYTEDCQAVPGGMHFELGYAYAKGKPCYLLGPSVHIFCRLLQPFEVLVQVKAKS